MLSCFDFAREMNFWAIAVRMVLAVVCGGLIGIEREYKRRPAGFRTHILICLGAAITTLTSQFLYLKLNLYTDVARLGAQVVAGIGFIGAGTIIVTNRQRVKGLTTAAGLWTSAIIHARPRPEVHAVAGDDRAFGICRNHKERSGRHGGNERP